MNTNAIHMFTEYNRWANARLLNAVAVLTPDQYDQDLSSSYRSVRQTLFHILGAEWVWLMRWKGISPTAAPDPAEHPTFESLKEWWHGIEMDQINFLSKISDEGLQEVVFYETISGASWHHPLWQMIYHQVNHSTYHRGQLVSLLRQLGLEGVKLDFIYFANEKQSAG